MPTPRSRLPSLALMLAAIAACGGGGTRVNPRGQRTASDCERLVRHVATTLLDESGSRTAAAASEVDAIVRERCADPQYLAEVNAMPDDVYACLLGATTMAQGDACRPAAPAPPPPADGCKPFAGTGAGAAVITGLVRREDGEAIIGATVVAIAASGGEQIALTDEQGAYRVAELAPGVYDVVVFADDPPVQRRCVSADGGVETSVDLWLPVDLDAEE